MSKLQTKRGSPPRAAALGCLPTPHGGLGLSVLPFAWLVLWGPLGESSLMATGEQVVVAERAAGLGKEDCTPQAAGQ